jgi:hypothetical protein
MGVQIIRGAEVNRPTPDALTSSVLDHATVVDKSDFGLRNNEGLWPSYNCLDLLIPTPLCPDPLVESDAKTFTVAGWVPGFEFAVYGGVECKSVGLDKNDQQAEVQRVFDLSAGKGVEQALLLNRFVARVNGSDETGPEWDAPVDLGTAPSLLSAIGMMEGYAAAHYAGLPTLHLPRAVITMGFGSGALVERDGKFYTKSGSKVAAGGGYDDNTAPISGTMDFFVTGEVYVERSEEIMVQTFVIPGDGSGIGSGENGLSDNTVLSLAERMFRVGVDCLVASVTATVWA